MATEYSKTVEMLIKVVNNRERYLQLRAAEIGIPWSYIPVLLHIRHNSGCKQNEIAKTVGVSSAAVTQSTQKMENMGLIDRETDSENQRANKLFITEKGREVLKLGSEIFDDADRLMFGGMKPSEAAKLREPLAEVNSRLAECLRSMGSGERGINMGISGIGVK